MHGCGYGQEGTVWTAGRRGTTSGDEKVPLSFWWLDLYIISASDIDTLVSNASMEGGRFWAHLGKRKRLQTGDKDKRNVIVVVGQAKLG